jgi:hypothetical protein
MRTPNNGRGIDGMIDRRFRLEKGELGDDDIDEGTPPI